MAHEVRARTDTKVVAHKDLEITVKSGGAKMGTLRLSWGRFALLIEEQGRSVKAKR